MEPTLRAGDRLLVRYGARPVPGDVVVARLVHGVLSVKRISHEHPTGSGKPGWFLVGDNPGGAYSSKRGALAKDAVQGVVRARVWPRPRRLRASAPTV